MQNQCGSLLVTQQAINKAVTNFIFKLREAHLKIPSKPQN